MLKFKANNRGNYTAGQFTIYRPRKKGGKWIVEVGSARPKTIASVSTLQEAQQLANDHLQHSIAFGSRPVKIVPAKGADDYVIPLSAITKRAAEG